MIALDAMVGYGVWAALLQKREEGHIAHTESKEDVCDAMRRTNNDSCRVQPTSRDAASLIVDNCDEEQDRSDDK